MSKIAGVILVQQSLTLLKVVDFRTYLEFNGDKKSKRRKTQLFSVHTNTFTFTIKACSKYQLL